MAELLKQSSTVYPLCFLLVQSSDHITGLTGASPTVTLSKAGGAFASPAGAVSEIANGWYKVAGNATDTATLGPLLLHAAAASGDPCDDKFEVVAFDPQDGVRLALSGLANATPGATGGLTIAGSNAATTFATLTSTGAFSVNGVSDVAQTGDSFARIGAPAGASISADIAAIKTETDTILTDVNNGGGAIYARLGAPAGASMSADIASVKTSVGAVTGAVGSVTGNVGGNVVGSTASVTGAVGSVTGNVGGNVVGSTASVTGAVGSVTGNVGGNVVGSVASVTAAVTVSLAQTLSAARNVGAIADTSLTLNDAFQCAIAAAAGKESVSGTTYLVQTPSTGTTIRSFTLDSGSAPTSRT